MQLIRDIFQPGILTRVLSFALIFAATTLLIQADPQPANSPTSADETPIGDPSLYPNGPGNNPNSQNTNKTSALNSDNTQSGTQAQSPGPADTQNPNSPLLPNQGVNTSPLYTSPNGSGGEVSPLTTPALYTTGLYDLSQVAANHALAQAFTGGGTVSSEQTPDQGPGPLDRIRLGPIDLKATLTLSVVSDDNIGANSASSQRVKDIEFGINPAVLLEYGAHEGQKGYASLVYAPTLLRFYHNSSQNSDNQNVAVNVQYPFQRLKVDATETYAQNTGVNIDTRSRTTQTVNVVTAGGTYDIDEKLNLASHFVQTDSTYSGQGIGQGGSGSAGAGQGGSRSAINSALSYQITQKLSFGPGFNIGLEHPNNARSQTYEQGLIGINYALSEKIGLFGQGGVEFRQYKHVEERPVYGFGGVGQLNPSQPRHNGDNNQINPIFNGGINYNPTDSTAFNISGFQTVQPSSGDTEQTDLNTGVAFTASKRLFRKFVLSFSFLYSHTEYTDNGGNGRNVTTFNANGSSQDNLVYRPSLTYAFTRYTNLQLYYQYQGNTSSTASNSYYDNQFGLSVSGQF